jgi:hypothetical protein
MSAPEMNVTEDALAKDLLWGVKAIADDIGRSERQAYHMLATGQLPAKQVGGRWLASREKLRRHLLSRVTDDPHKEKPCRGWCRRQGFQNVHLGS